jgi:hypothetical protein
MIFWSWAGRSCAIQNSESFEQGSAGTIKFGLGGDLMYTDKKAAFSDCLQLRKYILAGCELTPVNLLVKLASDPSVMVRRRIAENARTPINVLTMLSGDGHPDVRAGVCDNPSTPYGLLLLLSQDACPDVRYAIAENSHTPRQILCLCARDQNPYVAMRALLSLQVTEPILQPRVA